ncbi:hypothetical protein GGTG_05573 [Gaeumannomyces tritici R3-111a-1]|uniref:Alpha-mannosidase n=1 Tax=Gaeumannomyces tritici (strain R3-111a-1) TaxID=644352 RepID=J3NWA8_GAET3|nr:hypothetical protein GGTG_05573 [Gaeumannomyces tritici R3-111a-1]EJT75640.1 hypothetical protein GGTG_05573 [Gaeumannomyces tritici R3-111a-1]
MCGGNTSHDGDCGEGSPYPLRALGPVGKRVNRLYEMRLPNFLSEGGAWQKFNITSMLHDHVFAGPPHLRISVWSCLGLTRPTFAEATGPANRYREARVGDSFGPSWSTHWFRLEMALPAELRAAEHVELRWDAGNEGTVWSASGDILHGLTGRGDRAEWVVPFRDGEAHVVYVEMACNAMFGNAPGDNPVFKANGDGGGDSILPPDPNKRFVLAKAELVSVFLPARRLYSDMHVITQAVAELDPESWEQREALNVASRIMDAFSAGDKASVVECRRLATSYLGDKVDSEQVYNPSGGREANVIAIGHCHIDTCWLWPWAETRRKVARSWSNQCDLMDRYPELHFACSQAQQFQWLKQDYPATFERVKVKVKEGRFHPIGGSWVEHDTNMPSGESLIRQFLYGQRFFESEFGCRSRTSWLPDTFGQPSQIPQLCRQAGMDRFFAQKICFNSINEFPHTSFNWAGLDGSQVLTHMSPANTYCAHANLAEVKRSVSKHKTLDHDDTSLLVFGKGDGGGGPTWKQLERLRRLRGLADRTGQIPHVHLGKTVDDFFDRLQAKAGNLPTWTGELYFELHRGVYTTQARTKLGNRRSEFLLRDIELLTTIASIEDSTYKYPTAELDEMWQGVLLCQFHDCLPGTSIQMCYDDSDKVYAKVQQTGSRLLQDACSALGLAIPGEKESSAPAMAVSTAPWPRAELVRTADGTEAVARGRGNLLPVQEFAVAEGQKGASLREVSPGVFELENEDLRATVAKDAITSVYDKRARREALSGPARLVIFDDAPIYWQAWDTEVFHLDTRRELQGSVAATASILENGPHRASVVVEMRISELSSARVVISLSASLGGEGNHPYVECQAEVNWHETHKFLKAEIPVAVRSIEASYETQFGVVTRPTHYNTSWDVAKFEVCSHKFADLSEHGYGVSILNDCKYGFSTAGSVMRLSLLRSPKAPDETADMGRHAIRWAIMPHRGRLGSETVRAAFNFNNPLKLVTLRNAPNDAPSSPATTEGPNAGAAAVLGKSPIALTGDDNLVLDTIKRGEDDADVSRGDLPARRPAGTKSVIIRVYDSLGGYGVGKVETRWKLSGVFKTNILEDDGEEVAITADGHAFELQILPFQVQTYRLVLA